MFSAPMPPGTAAAANEAFKLLEVETWRVKKLQDNFDYFIKALKGAGFDTGPSVTAIAPIIIGDDWKAYEVSKQLFEEGIYLMPILPPAVPMGTARLRSCITSMHTKQDVDFFVDKLKTVCSRVGVPSLKETVKV